MTLVYNSMISHFTIYWYAYILTILQIPNGHSIHNNPAYCKIFYKTSENTVELHRHSFFF